MASSVSEQALAGLAQYRKVEREAYNASDLGLADNFTEDIILTSNGVVTLKGRETLRSFFRDLWSVNHARFVEVVDEDIVEIGHCLLVSGRFTLEITPKAGGSAIVDHGRFQGVLKMSENGRYRLWREACTDAGPAQKA